MSEQSGQVQPFPTDFSVLTKGSEIPPEELEDIYQMSRDDKNFYFNAQQKLGIQISDYFKREHGVIVTLTYKACGIQILTDDEATEIGHRRFQNDLSHLLLTHQRMAGVDTDKLANDTKRKSHDRRLETQGKVLGAVAHHSNMPELQPYKRKMAPMIEVDETPVEEAPNDGNAS
jgi:hypothetical protein